MALTPRSGAGFIVRGSPPLRDGERLGPRDRPLLFKISLVAHYDNRDVLVVLYPDDLLPETRKLAERRGGRDAED
jgi:hypothetical protein